MACPGYSDDPPCKTIRKLSQKQQQTTECCATYGRRLPAMRQAAGPATGCVWRVCVLLRLPQVQVRKAEPDRRVIAPLREAVAEGLDRRLGFEVSPDLVLITPGGKVAMFMAILMFGESGADIIYPDPGFPIYRSMIEFTGAKPVPAPMREENGFAFSAEETLALMTPATRLVILNSPANPTGGVTPTQEIDKLVAGLARFPGAAILSDEIYGQLIYDGLDHRSLLAYPEIRDRLILLDGFSKTYAMTGWRLGFSVWPKLWRDVARKLAVNSYSCVNSAAQFAGVAALKGPRIRSPRCGRNSTCGARWWLRG